MLTVSVELIESQPEIHCVQFFSLSKIDCIESVKTLKHQVYGDPKTHGIWENYIISQLWPDSDKQITEDNNSCKVAKYTDTERQRGRHFTSFLRIRTKTDHWENEGEILGRKGVRRESAGCDEFLFISLATMAELNCLQYVLSPATDEQYQFGQIFLANIFLVSPMKYIFVSANFQIFSIIVWAVSHWAGWTGSRMSLGRGKPALITVNTPLPPLHKLLEVLVTNSRSPHSPDVRPLVTGHQSGDTRKLRSPGHILAGKATANSIYITIGKMEKTKLLGNIGFPQWSNNPKSRLIEPI